MGVTNLVIQRKQYIWLALLMLVVGTNYAVYNTALFDTFGVAQSETVVLGSLLDLLIVSPILVLLFIRGFSFKLLIGVAALGCVLARLVIPDYMLAPYNTFTLAGIALEALLITVEIILLVTSIRYTPKIVAHVKGSREPLMFAYNEAVARYTKNNPLIRFLSSDLLVLYYAFATWKKAPSNGISIHQNSSFIALQIMMIHAIAIESVGIHWWLHSKAPILSIILLIVNIYGIIFLLGDLQAMRLNRVQMKRDGFYISLGLMKRAYIQYDNIDSIILENEQLQQKKSKDCAEFIVRDFEKVYPQFILKMKDKQTVQSLYGFKKRYQYVAIKCDTPNELMEIISRQICAEEVKQ